VSIQEIEKKATILVVEDDTDMARMLKMLLEGKGYSVVVDQGGAETLDMLGLEGMAHPGDSTRPDLILLDVMMERLDGYQVCKRLKQDERLGYIPVIMLAAQCSLEDRVRGLDCGANDYITKPFSNAELLARIRAQLRIKRSQDEYKWLKEMLRRNDKWYRSLVEMSKDAIFRVRADGATVFVSPVCRAIFGYEPEEFVQDPDLVTRIVHPDYREQFTDFWQQYYTNGVFPEQIREWAWLHKDGRTVYTENLFTNIPDEQGNIIGFQVAVRDVTEYKQVKEAYRAAVEHSLKGLVIVQDFRFVFANAAFADVSGYTVEEILSLSPEEVKAMVHPEDQALVWGRFRDCLAGKPVPSRYEYRGIRKDGLVRWLETMAMRIEYRGKPAVQGAIADITERRRGEEEIYKLLKAIETAKEAINITLADGTIMYTNDVMDELFGYKKGELIGKYPSILNAGPTPKEVTKRIMDAIEREGYWEGEIHNKRKDGSEFISHARISAIRGKDGSIINYLSTQHDITQRKRAEEALRRRNRELALLRRAGRMLSSTLDLDQVLVTVLKEVRRLLDVVACSIWLIEQATEELVCRQATGPQSEIVRGWRLGPGEGLAGWVAQSGESLIMPDVRTDERHFKGVDEQTGLQLRSILSVPLRVKKKVIGVLQVMDEKANRFGAKDARLLEPLAAAAAVAIENARLYQETDRLRTFNENIVQDMEEGILLEDATGHITFVNPRTTELLGYPPEELVGRHWRDIVPPEQMAVVEKEIAKRSQGIANRYETVLLTKGGQRVPVIVSARLLFDDGHFSGVLTVFTDIAERKQVEEALQEAKDKLGMKVAKRTVELKSANERLQLELTERKRAEEALEQRAAQLALINDIGEKIAAVLELDSLLDRAARLVRESFDYHHVALFTLDDKRGELVMRARAGDFAHLFPPDHRLKLDQGLVGWAGRYGQSLLVNDVDAEPRYVNLYPDVIPTCSELSVPIRVAGEVVGVLDVQSPQLNAFDENDVMVIETLADQVAVAIENARLYEAVQQELTERKRTEKALRQSEERFRSLFENAPLCIFEIDLGRTRPTIVRANRRAEQIYGEASEEFASTPLEKITPSEAMSDLERMVEKLKAGQIITLESFNQRSDGSVFPVRICATPGAVSAPSRAIITVEDITAERVRYSEGEAIAEERRRIAREIHDGLAQDLASLRFKVRLWHDLVDHDPAQMHAELDALRELLGEKIHQVRRSIFALRPVALDQLGFFPALHQFAGDFGELNQLQIDLRISGPEDRLPSSLEPVLFRIIQEALNNVGKHARASMVWVELDLTAVDSVTLTVRDDGRGFDLAILDGAVRRGHVGLKQMCERVEELKGTFLVQSQVGRGTRIQVVMPLSQL